MANDYRSLAKKELTSLIEDMDRISRHESGHFPKESLKRTCVFKWIAAVAMAMGQEVISDWLTLLVPPLYKQLSDTRLGLPQ